MTDNWVPFRDIDWLNRQVNQVHIDTRDFHALVQNEPPNTIPDLTKILKTKERFFFTNEEIKSLIERYFNESGGDRKWRFFCLEKHKEWFKYIRCFKTEHGWLIFDRYTEKVINKEVLLSSVIKDDYDKP